MTELLCIVQTKLIHESVCGIKSTCMCFQESIYNRKKDMQVSYLNGILS